MLKSGWLMAALALSTLSCLKSKTSEGNTNAITADKTLSKLVVLADQLEPAFDPYVFEYTLVGGETRKNKLSINAAPTNPALQIFINEVKLRSDFTTDPMPLAAGANLFSIALRDSSGNTVSSYKLNVQRVQELVDEGLDDLAISDGTLMPNFSPDVYSYTLAVGKDSDVLTVSPIASYPDEASFIINGKSYTANKGGYDVDISPGANTVTIIINGRSGRTKTYTILVTRPG